MDPVGFEPTTVPLWAGCSNLTELKVQNNGKLRCYVDIGEQIVRYLFRLFLGIVGAKFCIPGKIACRRDTGYIQKHDIMGAPFLVFLIIACGHDLLPRCGFAPHISFCMGHGTNISRTMDLSLPCKLIGGGVLYVYPCFLRAYNTHHSLNHF